MLGRALVVWLLWAKSLALPSPLNTGSMSRGEVASR